MIPRGSSASLRITSGRPEVVDRAHLEGNRAADDRDRSRAAEGVDAEAREAGDLVGEVGLADLVELLEQRPRRRAMCSSAASVSSSVSGSEPSIGASSPWRRAIGGEPTLTCRSEPSRSTRLRRAASMSNIALYRRSARTSKRLQGAIHAWAIGASVTTPYARCRFRGESPSGSPRAARAKIALAGSRPTPAELSGVLRSAPGVLAAGRLARKQGAWRALHASDRGPPLSAALSPLRRLRAVSAPRRATGASSGSGSRSGGSARG